MSTALPQRILGSRTVSAIGLGGMPMSIEGRPDEDRSITTIHAALDAGVTLIDTADAYHRDATDIGHNELLIARALKSYSGDKSAVIVATKGGHYRPGDGSWKVDGRPEHILSAAKASARRLDVDVIDLYQFHRPDPQVPYEDSIGALRILLDEGIIRSVGISNANIAQIALAQELLGGALVSVQNQFSPRFRSSQAELDYCREHGLAFLPWSPLGGIQNAHTLAENYPAIAAAAAGHGVSPQRVTLAWELNLGDHVIPIPGASRPESIADSARAATLMLSPQEISAISAEA